MQKLLSFLTITLTLIACRKTEFSERHTPNHIPEEVENFLISGITENPLDYTRTLPNYLQVSGMTVRPVSNEKATIGRILFYDRRLSKDGSISCASCHSQSHAFSDTKALSTGVFGQNTARNSMPIANVVSFSAHYETMNGLTPLLLWDNRAANVAEQAQMAFLNDHEMGMTMDEVVGQVQQTGIYEKIWRKAYGDFNVDRDKLLECLSEFVGAVGSTDSRFDQAMERMSADFDLQSVTAIQTAYTGTNTLQDVGLTSSELMGRNVFITNCSKCHSPIRPFQEVMEACNGLDMNYTDTGKGALTGLPADVGVFKAPSLRNIALTAPYMHDGRFSTLEQVVDFYSTGVQNHPNLHPEMRKNGQIKRFFSDQQKEDLLHFLQTLSDPVMQQDLRFSDPFLQ